MLWLKQSTAVTVKIGPFVDSTDGNTQETALTISQADIRLSKNGGAFAQSNNVAGATHDANGWYGVPLDTTDTNTLGTLTVFVHETGALAVWRDFMVVPANVWDSLFGADKLQVHADEITAGLITATAIATGAIDADAIAADAITAAKVAADVSAEIADAVWDEASADHVAAGSVGERVERLDIIATGGAGGLTNARAANLDNLDATVSTRATPAQVNTEVVDALNVDTYAEPGQATPPATATLVQRLQYLYKAWRNRTTQTATQYSLYGDDALTVHQKGAFSDDGTTADRGEIATGP